MVYFDNAATTFPKPITVLKAATQAITEFGGNPGRGGHKMAMRASEQIYNTREALADFFSCEAQDVIFTQNCTMALNIAIKGLFCNGGHILCSCLEHNSVLRPLEKLKTSQKLSYSVVDISNNDDDIVKAFADAITSETKGIVCTHASNVSGRIMPIKQLGKLCKDRGLVFIVDAAQSGGVIPISMELCNINALCIPGHKGLYGITGSGALLLRNCTLIDTIIEGGTGSLSSDLAQPDFFPDRLESGTVNTVGIIAMKAGLDFIKKLSLEKVYKHEIKHCKRLYSELSSMDSIKLYQDNFKEGLYVPIVSFNIGNISSERVVGILNESGFALRGGLHCSPSAHNFYKTAENGMVRFSPSVFTTDVEVSQFIKIIFDINKKTVI